MELEDRIRALDDATARQILGTIAKARGRDDPPPAWTPDLRDALQQATGLAPPPTPTTEGDLAREALLVLAADAGARPGVQALLDNPGAAQKFDFGLTLLAVTAALVVLHTDVDYRRDKDGKWQLKVKVTKTSESLIRKLLGFLPKGGE